MERDILSKLKEINKTEFAFTDIQAQVFNLLMEGRTVEYISNELHNNLKLEDIKTMDFGHLQASEVVKRSLEDAYQVFELFYGEA